MIDRVRFIHPVHPFSNDVKPSATVSISMEGGFVKVGPYGGSFVLVPLSNVEAVYERPDEPKSEPKKGGKK